MEYVFGTQKNLEVLKTKGDEHTNLTGYQQVVRTFPGETIIDNFRVVRKTKREEDSAGNCYDWYIIDRHYRQIDHSKSLEEASNKNAANIDYISMMAGIDLPEEEVTDHE